MLALPAVKTPDLEPLPGYRLLEPLGKGGFGEVWKCVAPDGQLKAIKFVASTADWIAPEADAAAQERRAVLHVQSIRHPGLLSIDHVEVREGELIIVMELADRNLQDVLVEHHRQGRPGIPRRQLLDCMRGAAEALDVLNQQHHLQHSDIKPPNLFLVGGQVKVADFGMVASLAELTNKHAESRLDACSPLYAAPENFQGHVSLYSDQYSLAITYHELLTGTLPFTGKNFRQLALQHLQCEPDLSRLSSGDRAVLARALAKDPNNRFPSCLAFVRALEEVTPETPPVLSRVPVVDSRLRGLLDRVRGNVLIRQWGGQRYRVQPGPFLEHRCYTELQPDETIRQLDAFGQQWNALCLASDATSFFFQISTQGRLWHSCLGLAPALEIGIQLEPGRDEELTRVDVKLWPIHCGKTSEMELLEGLGMKVLASLRQLIGASPERRDEERLPCESVVIVYPLHDDGVWGDPITGRTLDVSAGGVCLSLPIRPATNRVYLEMYPTDNGCDPVSLAGNVTYCRQAPDGFYTTGVCFLKQPGDE